MPVMDCEEFREIPGYPGYVINQSGTLKRLPYRRLHPKTKLPCKQLTKEREVKFRKSEYMDAEVHVNGKRMTAKQHRLIALAFLPNPNNYPQINHINGDRYDNRLENLEWCSAQQNVIHSYKTGLASNSRERHPKTKFSQADVDQIRKMREEGAKLKDIAKTFNSKVSTVCKITKGTNWR